MADKYIKVQDAKDEFYYALADRDCAISDYKEAYELLDGVEVADVRPVARGRWVDSKLDGVPSHCSECNYPIERFYKTHFCPNCGAKMEVQKWLIKRKPLRR